MNDRKFLSGVALGFCGIAMLLGAAGCSHDAAAPTSTAAVSGTPASGEASINHPTAQQKANSINSAPIDPAMKAALLAQTGQSPTNASAPAPSNSAGGGGVPASVMNSHGQQ